MISATSGLAVAVALLAIILFASACGNEGGPTASEQAAQAQSAVVDTANLWKVAEADPQARWLPVLATQDLAVGVKRIAFSLDGLGVDDDPPTVRVSLFALEDDQETPTSVQYARFIAYDPLVGITSHGHANSSVSDRALPVGAGIYVVPVQLSAAGLWGMLIEMESGGNAEVARLRFSVRGRQAAPRVGDLAPSVESRTRADVATLAELSSDRDPEPGLYAISIAEALELERPLLLAFATPAFCHSRTCAPVLDSVKTVWRAFASEISGIHVEVFQNPTEIARLIESAAFVAWRLPSEPWVFVIDRDGVIRYAFEGAVTDTELRSAVEWVVQDGEG